MSNDDSKTISDKENLYEEQLLKPYTHILQVEGKLLRKKIPLVFNHWLKVPVEKLNEVVDTVNMVHNGTLLTDDIQDNSLLRRTIPAAHCVFGLALTVNTSLHVVHLGMEKVLTLGHSQAIQIYSEQMLDMIRGQGIDIYWRDNYICPSEEEYLVMIKKKTGAMFKMAILLLQLFSEDKRDFTKLIDLLGIYYQIRDDYCNICNQEELEDWPGENEKLGLKEDNFCEDITEGKFSLPIIHALQTPEGTPIFDILKQRTRDRNLKKYCVYMLEKLGSLQYTRDKLTKLHGQIEDEVKRLGGNPEMTSVLEQMFSWKKQTTVLEK